MRLFICALVFVGAFVSAAAEDHVIVLDVDNFDTVVAQGRFVRVLYTP